MNRNGVTTILTICLCLSWCAATRAADVRSATQPVVIKTSPKKLTKAATQIAAAATQASTQPSESSAPTTFPTPAELIAKMRSNRKVKDALPHVAYFNLSAAIVEKS